MGRNNREPDRTRARSLDGLVPKRQKKKKNNATITRPYPEHPDHYCKS